jgi:hypothetical protein
MRRYSTGGTPPWNSIGVKRHKWAAQPEVRNGVTGLRGTCGGPNQDGQVFEGCGHDHGWTATLPEARDLNQDHLHEVMMKRRGPDGL